MVAILSRIFDPSGPLLTPFTVLGLIIMVLGGLVCIFSRPIMNKITGRENSPEDTLPVKYTALALAAAGFIILVICERMK